MAALLITVVIGDREQSQDLLLCFPTQQEVHRTQQTQNRLSKWRLLAAKTLLKSCGDLEKCLFPDANVVLRG